MAREGTFQNSNGSHFSPEKGNADADSG